MKKLRVLIILDPLEKLALQWDTSLDLLREFSGRGHETWICDFPDIDAITGNLLASVQRIHCLPGFRYSLSAPDRMNLRSFQLVLIRKEPPFDETYLTMTYLLERLEEKIFISNRPQGIRNTNEKLSILRFPKWIPQWIVSERPERILSFQKKLASDMVIKPLDLKGGEGVFQLERDDKAALDKLQTATRQGRKPVMAQRFLTCRSIQGDKRILLLNGGFLAAYEKHCKPGEFRANLSLGGTFHPAHLSSPEKRLIEDLKPYLRREGIHLAGVDVMKNKLIEINVTSPAGLPEAKLLYPQERLTEKVADFLERKARRKSA